MIFERRAVGPTEAPNVWFAKDANRTDSLLAERQVRPVEPIVLPDEESVGRAMLAELEEVAAEKTASEGPDATIRIALLGGRGAQALHKSLGQRVAQNPADPLIRRLVVFTQDALAPLPMDSPLSFVRDFERLMGVSFFQNTRRFMPFETETLSPEASTLRSLEALEEVGGLDIFFLGHGPEAEAASHVAYIKPGSGARITDWGGAIPISSTILEHHISKFKAGGSPIAAEDEAKCRAARYILTLGPAAILNAKRVVQSVVDAGSAPAKIQSYRRVMETKISEDPKVRAEQLDANPGLWVRLHDNLRSYVLGTVLGSEEIGSAETR